MPVIFNPETNSFVDLPYGADRLVGFPEQDPGATDIRGYESAAPQPEPAPDYTFSLDETEPDQGDPNEPSEGEPETSLAQTSAGDNLGVTDWRPPKVGQVIDGGAAPGQGAPVAPAPALTSQGYSTSRSASSSGSRYKNPYVPAPDYTELEAVRAGEAELAGRSIAGQRQAIEQGQAALGAQQGEYDQEVARQAKEREVFGSAYEKSMAESEQRIQEAMKAVPTKDPGRAFSNMNGFAKALMVLSAGLAGYNYRATGGKNVILDTIGQIIERDMLAQDSEIETARQNVSNTEQGLWRNERRWQNRDEKMRLGHVARTQAIINHFETIKANTQSEVSLAKLDQEVLGPLYEKRAKDLMDIQEANQKNAEVNARFSLESWQQSIAAKNAETARMAEERQGRGTEDGGANVFAQSPFNQRDIELGINVSEGEAKSVREGYSKASNLLVKVKNYRRLRERIGRKYRGLGENLRGINEDDKQALDQAASEVFYAVRKDATGAAASKQEDDIVRAIQGSPDGYLNATTLSATKGLEKSLTEERRVMASTYKMHYADDKKPVDVYAETKGFSDIGIADSKNPFRESKRAVSTILTGQDPKEAAGLFDELADYYNSDSANAKDVPGMIAGSFKNPGGGADTSLILKGASTTVTAVDRVRTEALRLAAIANAKGDSAGAEDVLESADRLIKAMVKPQDPSVEAAFQASPYSGTTTPGF